jgi:hypothetical protein
MGGPPGAIPPPPGFTPPPEPAQDPRRDPYAAQQAAVAANLAAFYTAGGALPGDADAVKEGPKRPKPWALIGAAGGAGLLFFFIGWAIGNISVSRNDYNVTTEHAARIRDKVDKIHKQVEKVKQTFLDSRPKKEGEPPNFAAIDALGEIDFKEPDMSRDLFHTNYFSFEPSTVQQLFNYYNDTSLLAKQITDHAARTKNDRESIERYIKSRTDKDKKDRLEGGLGVIFDYSGKLPTAQLVETLGSECPKADDQNCGVEERKAIFRTAFGGTMQRKPVKGLPKDIVISINPTELMQKVMSSDPGSIAFQENAKRTALIFQTIQRITETEKQLIEGLKKRANQPHLFSL